MDGAFKSDGTVLSEFDAVKEGEVFAIFPFYYNRPNDRQWEVAGIKDGHVVFSGPSDKVVWMLCETLVKLHSEAGPQPTVSTVTLPLPLARRLLDALFDQASLPFRVRSPRRASDLIADIKAFDNVVADAMGLS